MTAEHQSWRSQGACESLTPDEMDALFWIGKGKSPKKARQFCSSCPVKQQCLEFALVHNEEGIWAGTTQAQRKALAPLVGIEFVERVASTGRLETRNPDYWFNDDVIFGRAS